MEPATKAQEALPRRVRKAHFGELVQMDGSFHDWLERRGPRGCLMDMVDDATGTTQARLGKEETMWAAVGVLRAWIEKYGVPRALYTDWKNVYKRRATPGEQLRGEAGVTQFGRMCQKLGIRILAASSPQANAYASHCTSFEHCDTTEAEAWRRHSLTPWAFLGISRPTGSYRCSGLSV